jgi:CMP-N-acetylneuraminic acid synthetase
MHTGAMDIMRTKTVRELKSTSGKRLGFFFMSPEDSVNIDSPMDFEMAEKYLTFKGEAERGI